MKQGHDTLAMRLALILKKLISGERFTIEDLSREFGVGKRTIQRDLNERFNFLEIVRDEEECYCLDKHSLGLYGLKDIRSFAYFSGIENLYPKLDEPLLGEILSSKQDSNAHILPPPPPIF
ncbi:HTH domain-containing protein [Helicobacter sp. UBA3407]|uniref:HTH domain-containing protein n=1 Tax=Helicobacter TaxID=209 RepID=UPI002630839E|nr:HTH domain-containing protein [Helicobacter sp. UBA3407]